MNYEQIAQAIASTLEKNEKVINVTEVVKGGERVLFAELRVITSSGDVMNIKVKQVIGGMGK